MWLSTQTCPFPEMNFHITAAAYIFPKQEYRKLGINELFPKSFQMSYSIN